MPLKAFLQVKVLHQIYMYHICKNNYFLDVRVLICDFHREQAWERWVKKSENQVGPDKDKVLTFMRGIANAECEKSCNNALQIFESSSVWENNPKLQKYFTNIWLKDKEV